MYVSTSALVIFGAIGAYVVAMAAFAVDISGYSRKESDPRRERRRAASIGMATTVLGFTLHALGLTLRIIDIQRWPLANMYEFTLVFTLVAVGAFLGIQRVRDVRYLGVLITLVAVAALMIAVLALYVPADGVQPALNSYWMAIHVSVAAASTGVFTLSALASVLQLVRHRYPVRTAGEESASDSDLQEAEEVSGTGRERGATGTLARTKPRGRVTGGRLLDQLPAGSTLERFAYRLNAVAFVGWTFTLIAGAIWAEHAWGRAWGWDPKETWTLVIWLIYAAYLHVRATAGWASHKFAYFALVGFLALMANFYIVNIFFSGKHSYAGV